MYNVTMWTSVGLSGIYCECIDGAMRHIVDIHDWYYCKLTDKTGATIFERHKPYFVRHGIRLTDNYTGNDFWSAKCFETLEEAHKFCPNQEVIVLNERMDYLKLMCGGTKR